MNSEINLERLADTFTTLCGGSDANIFNGYGLSTAILATGMSKVHSTDEWVDLRDMRRLTEMLIALVCTSE
jgi:tripeptide aminopeptidase